MTPIALIVEDRPEVALLWERSLHKLDMEVRIAPTLKLALEIMTKIPPPDLVLLDLRLEDSDVMNTLNNIKTFKEHNPQAVIMVISGLMTPEYADFALAQGAVSALDKKVMMEQQVSLWDEIKTGLGKLSSTHKQTFASTLSLLEKLTQRNL